MNAEQKHTYIRSWGDLSVVERNLANSMAILAEQNGIQADEFRYCFKMALRSLKSKSKWAE